GHGPDRRDGAARRAGGDPDRRAQQTPRRDALAAERTRPGRRARDPYPAALGRRGESAPAERRDLARGAGAGDVARQAPKPEKRVARAPRANPALTEALNNPSPPACGGRGWRAQRAR